MQDWPQIKIGLGMLSQAGSFFSVEGKLLVLARGTAKEQWLPELMTSLKEYGMQKHIQVFSDFCLNPQVEDTKRIAADLGAGFDAVLAFGGGSTIDTAKAIVHYSGMKSPIFVVPSIVGTGSEQTSFAALYHDAGKISINAPSLLPTRVLVDAEVYRQAQLQAKNGPAIDCLCQAIESYWAKGATSQSRADALDCMRICSKNICKYATTSDTESAVNMGKASILSGRAINVSKTTTAHALSYGLSLLYGIRHGQGVALSIANLFEFNKSNIPEISKMMDALGLKTSSDFKPWFADILECIGIKKSINDFNILDLNIDRIVDCVNVQRLENNPTPLSRSQLAALFA